MADTITLARMRYRLRQGLGGLDTTDLPDVDADELLNWALWELEDKFPFKEKECLRTAQTLDGMKSYDLPSDLDALKGVAIQDSEGQWYPLERISEHREDEIFRDSADTEARPTKYYREDDKIVLHPTPDKAYTMQIRMWRTVASLLEGQVETPGLPRNWHELVIEGAIARGHFYSQDYDEARQATNFQLGKVRGAVLSIGKEEKFDSRYARVRPIDSFPGES